jgi:hypothetical protein
LALASAIDAIFRKQKKFTAMKGKTEIADRILGISLIKINIIKLLIKIYELQMK